MPGLLLEIPTYSNLQNNGDHCLVDFMPMFIST